MSEQWIDVAAENELPENEGFSVTLLGRRLALFRLVDGVFALDDLCSHGKARLSEGFVEGDTVECPLHQGLVCIRTGTARSPPLTEPVASHPVRLVDGRIQVQVA